jgi:hypothetical protein
VNWDSISCNGLTSHYVQQYSKQTHKLKYSSFLPFFIKTFSFLYQLSFFATFNHLLNNFNLVHQKYPSLEENWVFVTNQFVTTSDYLSSMTIIGYFCIYFLHLVVLATILQLTCNYFFFHSSIWTTFNIVFIQLDPSMYH